ncbi:hypothetical protein F2P81_024191 [Scophthalmus maximus]|uniref:Uncharacterized protein n=1 Tax=Scophthalmus maximus TaxID=52904 RepID=A0A6A4RWW2_SCOMX|nr:hypothetical protein F2P81_024191 [Scophthalmus maximus]
MDRSNDTAVIWQNVTFLNPTAVNTGCCCLCVILLPPPHERSVQTKRFPVILRNDSHEPRVPLSTPVLQRYVECTKYTYCSHEVTG